MNKILTILLLIITLNCHSQSKTIEIKPNYNVETLVICFEIANNGFWNFPYDGKQPMRAKVRNKFREFSNHKAVKTIDSLVSKGFWLDAMLEVIIKSSPIPSGQLKHKIDKSTLEILSSEKNTTLINDLIKNLNDFYVDADLNSFFKQESSYYEKSIKEVEQNLPRDDFLATMELYYGKENNSYTLVPSPILYETMGFGKRIKSDAGFNVFSIFGPVIKGTNSLNYGFGFSNFEAIQELTVHEFGHSFINPIVENLEITEQLNKYSHLFEPIKKQMAVQGYRNWRTCFIEHLVRLGEIRIAIAQNDTERANKLREDYVQNKSFIYIETLENEITKYEKNRSEYKNIEHFIIELINSLENVN